MEKTFFFHGFKRKQVSTLSTDDSDTSQEPNEKPVAEICESMEPETPSNLVDIPFKDDSMSSFEFEMNDELVNIFDESKDRSNQPYCRDKNLDVWVEIPLRDDLITSSEPEQPVIESRKPKKTWKQRLCCCVSRQTDD